MILWGHRLAADTPDLDILETWAGHTQPDEGWLILWAPEADRRVRAVKILEKAGLVRSVETMSVREAQAMVRSLMREGGCEADEAAVAQIVATVGTGFDALEQETQKLRTFTDGGPVGVAEVAAATTGCPDLSVFRLTDAVSQRRIKEALPLIRMLLDRGEQAVGLLALLAREVRLLARTKELQSKRRPVSSLGLPPFVVERLQRQAAQWSVEDVRRAFERLLEADRKLKTGGRPDLTLELCVIDMLEPGPA